MDTLLKLQIAASCLARTVKGRLAEDRGISMLAALIGIAILAGAAVVAFGVVRDAVNSQTAQLP